MKHEQLETIVGLMTGLQLCIIHLANVVAQKTGTDVESIAASFEETAEHIPPSVDKKELLQLVARQVASGLRGSAAGPEWDALMSRLQH